MISRSGVPPRLTDPPGVPCPRCRTPIRLTVQKLLAGTPVFCSDCGLQLTMDRQASSEALDAVRALQQTMNDLAGRK